MLYFFGVDVVCRSNILGALAFLEYEGIRNAPSRLSVKLNIDNSMIAFQVNRVQHSMRARRSIGGLNLTLIMGNLMTRVEFVFKLRLCALR